MNYLKQTDPQINDLILLEKKRQRQTLMMIPSENYASQATEQAVGSILGNKYAEGYPNKRYYQGQEYVDQIEQLCIDRAKRAFNVPFVNVQPYSGSPANTAVFFALLNPGDTVMGLALSSGGHLTHGHPKVTFSGKYFNSIQYTVKPDGFIDYDDLGKQVLKIKPKLIVAGTTAYPRTLDFAKFSAIADSTNSWLVADISHITGLILAGVHPSATPHAHIITTTTHKTLRGPRGAMIMATTKGIKRNENLGLLINKAIFPGLQGGPHLNTIAGIAVALKEAQTPAFKAYGKQIVKNASTLAATLKKHGLDIVTDGTDNHLIVADVRPLNLKGKEAAVMLEKAGIVCNYNTVPFDPNPPFNPSGIRLGTPGCTSRGMKESQMKEIGQLIASVLKKEMSPSKASTQVRSLCRAFPIPKTY